MKSDLHELELHLHVETEKAILCSDDGEKKNAQWLPKSEIEIERKPKLILLVTMPEWLAVKKGFLTEAVE